MDEQKLVGKTIATVTREGDPEDFKDDALIVTFTDGAGCIIRSSGAQGVGALDVEELP